MNPLEKIARRLSRLEGRRTGEMVEGVITAVAGAELTVSIRGGDVDELRYVATWAPAAGQVVLVWVPSGGGDPLVVGPISGH